ncbi:tachykinin-like peptides receptor 86C [Macrobrachium nipponense]|uniref:tachykinin-like peptides receptor 86C n=1 Tax=Macrobrachium nipponense TaxID=159736 RepID=UPI0030C7AC34
MERVAIETVDEWQEETFNGSSLFHANDSGLNWYVANASANPPMLRRVFDTLMQSGSPTVVNDQHSSSFSISYLRNVANILPHLQSGFSGHVSKSVSVSQEQYTFVNLLRMAKSYKMGSFMVKLRKRLFSLPDLPSMDAGTTGKPTQLPFQMPAYQQALWVLAFGIMILGACVGNVVVIRIVLGNQRMRTTTNYFLVNLSVADLFMTLFNCVFNFVFMLKSHWAFGSVYCTISQFVAHASLAASVFTLAVISFDRFLNVMRPLKPRMSKCVCRMLLCIIWVVAASIAAPILPYATTIHTLRGERTICVIKWPDGLAPLSLIDYAYNVVILAVTYVVPMTAMIICYAVIGCKLCDPAADKMSRQTDNFKSKRKVVQMLALLVGLFALCWLPYHVYFIVVHHHPQLSTRPYVQHMYLAFYWLAMSNAMFNPIIYYLLNARFRYFFWQLLAGTKASWKNCLGKNHINSSVLSLDACLVQPHWDDRKNINKRLPMKDQDPLVKKALDMATKDKSSRGLFAPIIVRAKVLMQKIWKLSKRWDDVLPPELQEEWSKIKKDLENVSYQEFHASQPTEGPTTLFTYSVMLVRRPMGLQPI